MKGLGVVVVAARDGSLQDMLADCRRWAERTPEYPTVPEPRCGDCDRGWVELPEDGGLPRHCPTCRPARVAVPA